MNERKVVLVAIVPKGVKVEFHVHEVDEPINPEILKAINNTLNEALDEVRKAKEVGVAEPLKVNEADLPVPGVAEKALAEVVAVNGEEPPRDVITEMTVDSAPGIEELEVPTAETATEIPTKDVAPALAAKDLVAVEVRDRTTNEAVIKAASDTLVVKAVVEKSALFEALRKATGEPDSDEFITEEGIPVPGIVEIPTLQVDYVPVVVEEAVVEEATSETPDTVIDSPIFAETPVGNVIAKQNDTVVETFPKKSPETGNWEPHRRNR